MTIQAQRKDSPSKRGKAMTYFNGKNKGKTVNKGHMPKDLSKAQGLTENVCSAPQQALFPIAGISELRSYLSQLQPRDHACLIYESFQEWLDTVSAYIISGLSQNQRCMYIGNGALCERLRKTLVEKKLEVSALEGSQQLIFKEIDYNTTFAPERELRFLISETQRAIRDGYLSLRVALEVKDLLGHGGEEELLIFASRMNTELFDHYPCLSLCLFDRDSLHPEMIRNAILTHPLILRQNQIWHNFYYIPPEDLLNKRKVEIEVKHWLNNVERENKLRTELALKDQRIRSIYFGAPTAIGFLKDRVMLELNHRMCEITGYGYDELVNQSARILYPSDKEFQYVGEELYGRQFSEKGMGSVETIWKRKDGKIIDVEINLIPVDRYDLSKGVVFNVRDITEEKKNKRELEQKNKLLEAIIKIQSMAFKKADTTEIYTVILNEIITITESEYGFIGKLLYTPQGNPYIEMVAISDVYRNEDTKMYKQSITSGSGFYDLNTLCDEILKKRPIFFNDPSQDPRGSLVPEGHHRPNSFLGLPLIHAEGIIGCIGLANRPMGYSEELVEYLQPLISSCATVINALEIELERRSMENRLKESEERLRYVVENSINMFYLHDTDHVLRYVSPQVKDMLGYDQQEVQVKWTELITDNPINQIGLFKTIKAIETGEPQGTYELELLHKNKTKVWVEVRERPVVKDGRTVAIVGSLTDITERKIAEDQIQKRLKYEGVIAKISQFALELSDTSSVMNMTLKELGETLGVSRVYIFEHRYLTGTMDMTYEWVAPGISPQIERLKDLPAGEFEWWVSTLMSGGVINLEDVDDIPHESTVRVLKEQGIKSVLAIPIFVGGKYFGFIGFDQCEYSRKFPHEDVELLKVMARILSVVIERKIWEESLRERERRYRELFDEAPVGYHEVDKNGIIVRVNKTEAEMLGYEPRELLNRPVWEIIKQEGIREITLAKLSGDLKPALGYEGLFVRKDGSSIPVLVDDRLILDSNGNITGMRVTIHDISRLKELERQREELERQLRQAQKMEAVGQLAGGIAHDFNNILTAITGYTSLAAMKVERGSAVAHHLEEINKAAHRAADLTQRLLAFGRKQIMDVKVLDLNYVIKNLDGMIRRVLREDIELEILYHSSPLKVKADPTQLELVIINLVTNAKDAMPNGGTLTIELSLAELDDAYIKTHLGARPGTYALITVSDTGIGMSEEVKERIFEPFFTTKEKGKGTGLGLSMVYGIVKQSGGYIWVYSEPGKGTSFKIYLPLVEDALEGSIEIKRHGHELPTGIETLLVVEDQEGVLDFVTSALEMLGYKVIAARSGKDALKSCQGHQGPIHLIITDVVMPGMNGKELVDRLKVLYPRLKSIFMSGYTENAIVHHGVLEPGLHFLQKPFTLEALANKVRQVLDQD